MFTGITWKEYFITVTLLLTTYYPAAICWIYLNRLMLSRKSKLPTADQSFSSESQNSKEVEKLPLEVDKLIALLKDNIAHSYNKGYNREQLLKCLAKILCGYPSLKNTSFREHIHRSIINECDKYGPGLCNAELMGLWNARTLQTVP